MSHPEYQQASVWRVPTINKPNKPNKGKHETRRIYIGPRENIHGQLVVHPRSTPPQPKTKASVGGKKREALTSPALQANTRASGRGERGGGGGRYFLLVSMFKLKGQH